MEDPGQLPSLPSPKSGHVQAINAGDYILPVLIDKKMLRVFLIQKTNMLRSGERKHAFSEIYQMTL